MFKENLKTLRQMRGLTQKDLAKELGLSPQRYNYYETGRNEPDYETLKLIAAYLGVSLDLLLSDGSQEGGMEMPIDVSKFEKEIANEYMRLYGHEIPRGDDLTKSVVNVAATVAAIAIKLHEESQP